ncbi:hypothetical protein OpiT1DRAFT_05925 [Opitutaceae bacterium TAV1]|nr:hypothetical protein OpiT1DRAFT_05925 [Opitutaceae bacterium TAV1]
MAGLFLPVRVLAPDGMSALSSIARVSWSKRFNLQAVTAQAEEFGWKFPTSEEAAKAARSETSSAIRILPL